MIFLNLLLKYPVYYPYCALFWMFFMNLLHRISTWWTRPIHGSNAVTYQQSVITIIIDLDSNGLRQLAKKNNGYEVDFNWIIVMTGETIDFEPVKEMEVVKLTKQDV